MLFFRKEDLDELHISSGAYVVDRRQQLVPPGVIGELVVTGDDLARRNTGSDPDRGGLVEIDIVADNTSIKAYRIGDRAPYRRIDGELGPFGRWIQQIKTGGHHIESVEVEDAILKQDVVAEAAVVIQGDKTVAIVAIKATRTPLQTTTTPAGRRRTSGRPHTAISSWSRTRPSETMLHGTSMYDGGRVDRAEMQEWLDKTVQAMLDVAAPGSGMILFSSPERVSFSRGTGISSSPAQPLGSSRTRSRRRRPGRPHLHARRYDGRRWPRGLRPKLAVIN
ncbi:hypothetical protein MAPG_03455 [Magnaporthiopsis poae ATCC 64411]|uniref:AMP-dependent synthetase/ligase domain-containing protein n=1 Tax=Magnaporthiopsis poae (strain ATCC 64411 / 73-15) TaxID=644358 RepID=A0A0C4DU21_MAGP6|nr:hypothetical protein MAPG_03455 [Magnaporthiopsis poae ATCC 64411]